MSNTVNVSPNLLKKREYLIKYSIRTRSNEQSWSWSNLKGLPRHKSANETVRLRFILGVDVHNAWGRHSLSVGVETMETMVLHPKFVVFFTSEASTVTTMKDICLFFCVLVKDIFEWRPWGPFSVRPPQANFDLAQQIGRPERPFLGSLLFFA